MERSLNVVKTEVEGIIHTSSRCVPEHRDDSVALGVSARSCGEREKEKEKKREKEREKEREREKEKEREEEREKERENGVADC